MLAFGLRGEITLVFDFRIHEAKLKKYDMKMHRRIRADRSRFLER